MFAGRRLPGEVDALGACVRRAIRNTYIDGFRRHRLWATLRHLVVTPDVQPPTATRRPRRFPYASTSSGRSPRSHAGGPDVNFHVIAPPTTITLEGDSSR